MKATYDVEENGQYVTKELTATDLGLASLDQTLTADNKWTCNWNVPVYKILNQETGLKVKIDYTVEEGNVDSDYVYTSPSNGKAVSGDGNDYKKQTWNANTITTPDSKASADSTGSNSKKSTLSKVKAKVVSLFDDETTTVISDSTAENGVVIELGNKKLYSLPSTGGTGIYLYMIGGMLLMFAAVWILYKSKCKEVLEK